MMKSIQQGKMKRLSWAITVVTFSSLVISPAVFASFSSWYSDGRSQMTTYTLDCAHWYVGGNVGYSHLHDRQTPGTANSVDENGPGWNVNGGYQFNSLLGAELGYTQYHDSRETSGATNVAKTEHYAVHVAASGRYPLVDRLNALAKLGVAYSYANKIFTGGAAFSSGAVSPYWGLGLSYSITPKVDVVAFGASVRGNNYTGSSDLYSLGFTFAIV